MSTALIVTRGFGNGTLTGSIADVSTRGYTIGEVALGAIIMTPNPANRVMSPNTTKREMVPNTTKRVMVAKRG